MWKIDIDSETETKQFEKSIPILRLRPRDVKNRYRYWDWDLGMCNFDIDIETETTKSHDIETISIISSSSGWLKQSGKPHFRHCNLYLRLRIIKPGFFWQNLGGFWWLICFFQNVSVFSVQIGHEQKTLLSFYK